MDWDGRCEGESVERVLGERGNTGNTGRMRMLKYFVDKYPTEICRMV